MAIVNDYVFLVDENLPPALAVELRAFGVKAFHINEARSEYRRVTDDMIRRFTLDNKAVIVTADDDFVKSYFDRGVPEKLVFVYDMKSKEHLLASFRSNWPDVLRLLQTDDLIQIDATGVKIPGT